MDQFGLLQSLERLNPCRDGAGDALLLSALAIGSFSIR
jgi:hypothetical protein